MAYNVNQSGQLDLNLRTRRSLSSRDEGRRDLCASDQHRSFDGCCLSRERAH